MPQNVATSHTNSEINSPLLPCVHNFVTDDAPDEMLPIHASELSQQDMNRLVNKKLVDDVIPCVYQICLQWDSQKPYHETYFDYLSRNKFNEMEMKWITKHTTKLCEDSTTYDVTFLHDLLPHVCQNIQKYDPKKHREKSLEFSLNALKDFRNKIIHDRINGATCSDLQPKIEKEIHTTLKKLGNKFNALIGEANTNKIFISLKNKISEVRNSVITVKEQRIIRACEALKSSGKLEQQQHWKIVHQNEISSPSSTRVSLCTVFFPITFSRCYQEIGSSSMKDGQFENDVNCCEILNLFYQSNNVQLVYIEGNAGSGKSTFLKRIGHAFLKTENDCNPNKFEFDRIDNFEFMIFIECRSKIYSTFSTFISRIYSHTMRKLNLDDVIEAIQDLNCLILIDGLDEETTESKDLFNDILEYFRGRELAKIIVTSRPISAKNNLNKFYNHCLSFVTLSIKEITSEVEQINFLNKYSHAINQTTSSSLIEAFKLMRHLCSTLVCYPIYLRLFIHLYKENPDRVKNWINEASVMKQTLELSENNISSKIEKRGYVNPWEIANVFMRTLGEFCLRWLQQGNFRIDYKTCQKLKLTLFGNDNRLPIDELLSCILQEKISLNDQTQTTFHFVHASYQEYLAAAVLMNEMTDKPNVPVLKIMSVITGEIIDSRFVHER